LLLIDGDTLQLSGEILLVMIGVGLIPALDPGSASVDAGSLTEVSTLR
jgi:hypothetical protein